MARYEVRAPPPFQGKNVSASNVDSATVKLPEGDLAADETEDDTVDAGDEAADDATDDEDDATADEDDDTVADEDDAGAEDDAELDDGADVGATVAALVAVG